MTPEDLQNIIPNLERIRDQKNRELEKAEANETPQTINDLIKESESMKIAVSLLRELEKVSETYPNPDEGDQDELF